MAKRELVELLEKCAGYGLTTIVSYSDSGFVDIGTIFGAMANSFGRVERFSEPLRHHTQGRALASGRATVREKILVGYP